MKTTNCTEPPLTEMMSAPPSGQPAECQENLHTAVLNSHSAPERLLLRTLIDNLPDAVYAKDAVGRKILANPADLKNLRCKTEAEAIGKTDFDFFPRDIAEKFLADDQKVMQGRRSSTGKSISWTKKAKNAG